jgi:NAD(P)-dependent dehydrogenase (short-subunit alcohol dehydrogenase family)
MIEKGLPCCRKFNAAGVASQKRGAHVVLQIADLTAEGPILGNGSSIVFISSLGARAVVGALAAYAATKGAIDTLVKHFAAALGARGIRVNAVAPGIVDTDMSNFTKTDAGQKYALNMQALQRLARPEDIGPVVAFLASDDARWITGDTVRVDGGSKL